MDSGANTVSSVGESSPPVSPSGRPVAKGRGLRRWRRIPREHHDDEGSPAGPVTPAAAATATPRAEEDLAQLHKRRLPVGADAPKGKQDAKAEEEEDSPVASVESSFLPPEAPPSPTPAPAPTKLDPDLGFLIASTGFSLGAGGADSDNSDDRTSKSSTALPRHDFSLAGFGRDRDRARSRAPGAAAHAKNLRTARARGVGARAVSVASSTAEAENSRSSVESDLRSTGAAHARKSSAGVSSNGVHKFMYADGEHSDEEPPSEHLRSPVGGFYKENVSVVGRMVMGNGDLYAHDNGFEGSIGKGENGGIHSGLDPYTESISMLQSAQEALENEIQMFVEIGKENSDNSTANYDENEWSGSPDCEEFSEELGEKLKLLESKLEEASTLIDEKNSRILELDTLNQTQPREVALYNSKLLSLQSEVDQLLMEKMEAEIQCFILTRASEAWQPQTEDHHTLYEAQKSLSEDHKQLEVKLRHTESRAMMLQEMTEKLESQCKDLSNASEVLKLQAGASRASVFCSIQLVLLCIAVWTFITRFLPTPTEFVPT
ncbi:hypothetical protein ACQ4PT_032395 [Festuca glaucescens]